MRIKNENLPQNEIYFENEKVKGYYSFKNGEFNFVLKRITIPGKFRKFIFGFNNEGLFINESITWHKKIFSRNLIKHDCNIKE
jgi:hypothetical protein